MAVDFPFFSGCWLQEEGLEETLLTFQWPPLSLSPSLLVLHVCMRVVSYHTLHAKTTIKSVCMYTQVLRHAPILTHTFRNILLLNKHGLYIQTYIQVHFLLLTTQYLKCKLCMCIKYQIQLLAIKTYRLLVQLFKSKKRNIIVRILIERI